MAWLLGQEGAETGVVLVGKVILLFLVSFPAHAPVVEWRLEPVWKEVNLCLEECVLKAYFVTEYVWKMK